MTIDIKDFYLNKPMDVLEFMRLKIADIPKNSIKLYNLRKLATPGGYIYVRIQKGMYGLPQAGIIAQQLLKKCLIETDIDKALSPPVFGCMTGDPSCLDSVWMTLD